MATVHSTQTIPPNIVYIDCHDLGNWLGCYGRTCLHTPNIDRLASEGALFTQMIATAPICMPSRASLYSGRMPHEVGAMGQFPFDAETVCMAEHLRQGGYETVLIGSLKIRNDPTWAGFEKVVDATRDQDVAERAAAFLLQQESRSVPFFLSLSFTQVHRPFGQEFDADVARHLHVPPYLPVSHCPPIDFCPEAERNMQNSLLVRQDLATLHRQIESLDSLVALVLAGLDASGLAANTLLVFTTEHGPAIARAKHTLYDSGLRTALLIRYPPAIEPGRQLDQLLSNMDLLPTILELAGIETTGLSFAPLLRGQPYTERTHVFAEHTWGQRAGLAYYTPARAVRSRQVKYIRNFTAMPCYIDTDWLARFGAQRWLPAQLYGQPAPPCELYDLVADPHELHNLAGHPDYAEMQAQLEEQLVTFLLETDDPILAGPIPHPQGLPAIPLWEPGGADGYCLRPYRSEESGERPLHQG